MPLFGAPHEDAQRQVRAGVPGLAEVALADVRTPQEAMARFQTLDPQRKMQLITMFMRVRDTRSSP